MKKIFGTVIVAALVLFISACGGGKKDGFYQAADNKNGEWTYFMTFEVKDGKIANVNYDGVNLRKGDAEFKKVQSETGKYVMGADKEWHEQAKLIEDYIVEHQGLDGVKFDNEGKSDAIAGATIHYSDTEELLKKALEAGPVEKGDMKDGVYFKEAAADDKGYVYSLGFLVNQGHILAATADAHGTKGDSKGKYKSDMAKAEPSEYDLGKDAVASYDKQALAVADYLIKNQTLDNVELNDEGKTDSISGATITVKPWVELYKELAKLTK